MKITRQQLRQIIRESLPHKGGQPWMDKDAPVKRGAEQYDDLDIELSDKEIEDAMGWQPAEDYDEGDGDHAEYDRGYQDGFDGVPPDSSYSTDYDAGYEDGQQDATLPDTLEEAGKGWGDQYGRCNSHNISPDEATEAIAVLQEFGYELGIPITVDSNNIAIDDALAAYPGEYTYEDFKCAVQVVQGRGA